MALGFKFTIALACAQVLVNRLKYEWLDARKRPHPLILDGLCLHVLSSFQRTGFPLRGIPYGLSRR